MESSRHFDQRTLPLYLCILFVLYRFTVSAVPLHRIAGPHWRPATATWYGSPDGDGSDGGACGYGSMVDVKPYKARVGAVSPVLFKGGEGCGACYKVKCSDNSICSRRAVTVIITDECPGGYCSGGRTHFDLSGAAFGRMAIAGEGNQLRNRGEISVIYRRTPCKYPGKNIAFRVNEGSTPYWLSLLVEFEDGDGDLGSMHIRESSKKKMADRYFPNVMPDFVAETPPPTTVTGGDEEIVAQGTQESLMRLLSMPYAALSKRLMRTALDLKETLVIETWGLSGQSVQDFTLYSGVLGTAFLLFKSYQLTNNVNDLSLSSQIVKACDSASSLSRDVTFICGRGGVCALGAVIAKHMGDNQMLNHYLTQFKQIKLTKDLPNELLYGRAGFIWACLYLNKHIGEGTIPPAYMGVVADEINIHGRKLGTRGRCPLMFEWYGTKYWGAAHGLAGIMHVLMDVELKPDEHEDVKATLKYMIKNSFPSGNYPSSEEDRRDVLVHWCHGATGMALTLVKAAEVYGDREFLEAAMDAAEVVWNRGLLKRVGICHGISGNTYVFLSLYRLTGNMEFLYRAKAFTCFLLDRANKLIASGEMHGGDSPYSLFEGIGGMAYLFLDMIQPTDARFPAYGL